MYCNYYNKKVQQRTQWTYRSVKECLDEGLKAKQIAEELGISEKTVSRYTRYIRENQKE